MDFLMIVFCVALTFGCGYGAAYAYHVILKEPDACQPALRQLKDAAPMAYERRDGSYHTDKAEYDQSVSEEKKLKEPKKPTPKPRGWAALRTEIEMRSEAETK